MYTRDLAGTRYSPLKQIDTSNVSKLGQAWTYKLVGAAAVPAPGRENEGAAGEAPAAGRGAAGGRGAVPAGGRGGGGNPEATPIGANGLMYLPAGRRVLGLDPETGKELWSAPLAVNSGPRG